MKLDNRDLVLRGLLGILPAQLERYLRSALGDHCTPETLRALLEGNEPAPEVPDLADLSTQIRILASHGAGEGGLLDLPEGLEEITDPGFLQENLHAGIDEDGRSSLCPIVVLEAYRLPREVEDRYSLPRVDTVPIAVVKLMVVVKAKVV